MKQKSLSGLNPYFFGKCSTALVNEIELVLPANVLILIFLENALRLVKMVIVEDDLFGLNPYFFGKCSTAVIVEDDLFADDRS